MAITKINNLLFKNEVEIFQSITKNINAPIDIDGNFIFDDSADLSVSKYLGRIQLNIKDFDKYFFVEDSDPNLPETLTIRLSKLASSVAGYELRPSSVTYVEYNSIYGKPNLPPHFDGDYNDLIINYQLESNTNWNLGIDFNTYEMNDNSALIFNPNEKVHWRPNKIFKPGEFVKMIFFRFENPINKSDYSELRKFWPTDEIFENIRNFRNNLVLE